MSASTDISKSMDACQICGTFDATFAMKKTRGSFSSTWVKCGKCKSAHIDPYPGADELSQYYNSNYTEMDFSGTDDETVSHRLRYSKQYEETIFSEYVFSLKDAGLEPSQISLNYKNILDFGCANGVFLSFLRKIEVPQKNIFGCDISRQMIEACRPITDNLYVTGELDGLNEQFDLITLWDVIEHIHDPKPTLKKLISMLTENGEILVQTPHYGLLADLMGASFAHYLAVEHINLFSREALIGIFDEIGMQCVSASSFGANVDASQNQPFVKSSFDKVSKTFDFGATQVLRFQKKHV
jgi:2-polyprenyl-3-methyl-5-hydroxy-6-metoxy-1,4-benzoquinol methylase